MVKYVIDLATKYASIHANGTKIAEHRNTVKYIDGIVDVGIEQDSRIEYKDINDTENDININYLACQILKKLTKYVDITYDDICVIIIPSYYTGTMLEEYTMYISNILGIPLTNCVFIKSIYCITYYLYKQWYSVSNDPDVTSNGDLGDTSIDGIFEFSDDNIEIHIECADDYDVTQVFDATCIVDDSMYEMLSENVIEGAYIFMSCNVPMLKYVTSINVCDIQCFDTMCRVDPCHFVCHDNYVPMDDQFFKNADMVNKDIMVGYTDYALSEYNGLSIRTVYKNYPDTITIEKDNHVYYLEKNRYDNIYIRSAYRLYIGVDMCDRPVIHRLYIGQRKPRFQLHLSPFNVVDALEYLRESIRFEEYSQKQTDDYVDFLRMIREYTKTHCRKYAVFNCVSSHPHLINDKVEYFMDSYKLFLCINENGHIVDHDENTVNARDYVKNSAVRSLIRDFIYSTNIY